MPTGADVVIECSGDVGKRDFITIVPVGEAEGKYADYKNTRSAQVELRAMRWRLSWMHRAAC